MINMQFKSIRCATRKHFYTLLTPILTRAMPWRNQKHFEHGLQVGSLKPPLVSTICRLRRSNFSFRTLRSLCSLSKRSFVPEMRSLTAHVIRIAKIVTPRFSEVLDVVGLPCVESSVNLRPSHWSGDLRPLSATDPSGVSPED